MENKDDHEEAAPALPAVERDYEPLHDDASPVGIRASAVEQRANETARSLKEKRVTVTTSGNGRIEKRGEIMKPDDKDAIIG